MITYKKLGINGRLGNQMFQYALLLGIKAKKGYDIVLEETLPNDLEFIKNFNINACHFYNKADIRYTSTYKEEFFHYDRRLFNKITPYTNLEGYFQSAKYFEHCEDLVRDQYTFRENISVQAKAFLDTLPSDTQKVSVHIRRTDYVGQPNFHPLASLEYYKLAMSKFTDKETTFIVLSDDIDWCRENFQGDNIVFTQNSTFVDLSIMSLCDHNIIANSSFSWWGAWLNRNPSKIVIAPKVWFGIYYFHYIIDDIYCNNWIKL